MANLTKTQVKSRLQKITEQLEELLNQIEDLKTDCEDEAENIEPYDGKDELTEAQEERQEWLTDTAYTLDTQYDSLADIISELDYIA